MTRLACAAVAVLALQAESDQHAAKNLSDQLQHCPAEPETATATAQDLRQLGI